MMMIEILLSATRQELMCSKDCFLIKSNKFELSVDHRSEGVST